ncbi:hypothetical protein [Allosphingosinicella vermicomposti]|uniref:hypothetical protein n=1 Tax=Allosphingosinicella vermicomposti TaxID=614671 RepID=UPI000D111EF3|nr:hypothetical protein [Allosphingosinicella vermicomposti]
MIARLLIASLFLLAAACDSLPRDPEGTLDRIRAEKIVRAGIVAGRDGNDLERAYLAAVARRAGARAIVQSGTAESLIGKLEAGEIDLLIGEFSPTTPWVTRVSFMPPLAERMTPYGNILLLAAARNGENEWIGLLHREAEALTEARLGSRQ